MNLPVGYLRLLDSEAKLLNLRRGQFLEMLLLRKLRDLPVQRPASAPKHKEILRQDLEETDQYQWYIKPELKRLLEEDCLSMGNIKPGPWVTFMINNWLGFPMGLKVKG